METIDLRPFQAANHGLKVPVERNASLFILGADQTVIFYWSDHETSTKRWGGWKGFCDFASKVNATSPIAGADWTDCFLFPDGTLHLDTWLHSYKWSGARSIYTPNTSQYVAEMLDRGFISPDTEVFGGNWAGLQRYERYGTAGELREPPTFDRGIVAYHGTSTARVDAILERGITPNILKWKTRKSSPDTTYFSTSRQRATYFAHDTVKFDRRHVADKKAKETINPILIEVLLPPEEFSNLVADEDWIRLTNYENERAHSPLPAGTKADWQRSIAEFGQFGVTGGIGPGYIVGTRDPDPTILFEYDCPQGLHYGAGHKRPGYATA